MASLVPFMPVIFTRHGLSEQAIGAISALSRWTNMPSAGIWSAVADRFQLHRVIVLFTFVVSAAVLVASSQLKSFKVIFGLTILQQILGAPAYGSIIDAVVIADIRSTVRTREHCDDFARAVQGAMDEAIAHRAGARSGCRAL